MLNGMALSHAICGSMPYIFSMAQCHYHRLMTTDRIPQAAEKYIVRFPDGMRDRIAEAAKQNNRSMNAEVVARLQTTFDPAPPAVNAAAQELADSRAQAITAMEFLQGSLCETLVAMYAGLSAKDQRDRTFANAHRLAASLLAGARPGDYLKSRSELLAANPALARFLEQVEADIQVHQKKEARTGRAGGAKR